MKLPKQIDPIKLAKRQATLTGQLPLAMCVRLQDSLFDSEGRCDVTLQFETTPSGVCIISGELTVQLHLVCNRCHQAMDYQITLPIRVSPVTDEASVDPLPTDCEPVMVKNGSIDLAEMLEDELLLNLPPYPAHPENSCAINN